jgi:hypothetical protein
MDAQMLMALLTMMQGQGSAPGMPGAPPGMAGPQPDIGALLTGQAGGGMNPPGTAPSTSSMASPPVSTEPAPSPGFNGPNGAMPTSTMPGTMIGSAPPGMDTGGLPPGQPTMPQTQPQAQAATTPGMQSALGGLAGIKAPNPVTPVMAGGVHAPAASHMPAMQSHGSAAIAALLQAILGGRGTQPLGVPALGASLRSGV